MFAYIYKHAGIDCSNGGISAFHNEVEWFVEGETPPADNGNRPVIMLRRGYAPNTCIAVPVKDGKVDGRPMFGGCFIFSSDSRFSQAVAKIIGHDTFTAVKLHDRYE